MNEQFKKRKAETLSKSLGIIDIKIPFYLSRLIIETLEIIDEKQDNISVKDIILLEQKVNNLYGIEEPKLPLKENLNIKLVNALELYFKKDYEKIKPIEIANTLISDFATGKNVGIITLKMFEEFKKSIIHGNN